MTNQEISALLEGQRNFYKSGKTLSLEFRREQLKRLYASVKAHEEEVLSALSASRAVSAKSLIKSSL